MINIAKRIIKQMTHDHRSLAMIIVVPLLLLSLLYLLLGDNTYTPTVATENLPAPLVSELEKQDTIEIVDKDLNKSNETAVRNGDVDAIISQNKDGIHILMYEADSVKATAVTDALKEVVGKINPQGQMNIDFLYGNKDQSTFDNLGFLLLGILAFFLIFLFSGISFVRERTSDTVERLMLTPVRTTSVVGGYVVGFGVFALIQSTLIILFAKFVLKLQFVGDWWLALLIMMLLAVVAVVLGVLISAVSKNEFQVMQFIPVIIVPQIFFSGLIPVDTLPYHLDYLSKIMPLYYGSMGLKDVLVHGAGIGDVLPQILALCAFIVVLFIVNIFAVKKYRAV